MSATAPTLDIIPEKIRARIPPPTPLRVLEGERDDGSDDLEFIIIELDLADAESIETPIIATPGVRIFDAGQRRYLRAEEKYGLTREDYFRTFFGDEYHKFM